MTDRVDQLAYDFWAVHPKMIDQYITGNPMPEDYPGGGRAWFFACEMRKLSASVDTALKTAHAELDRQFQTSPDAGYYQRKSDDTAHLDGTFDIRRLVEAIINGGDA